MIAEAPLGLARYLEPVTFAAGDVVAREDDTARELFFILEGEALVRRREVDIQRLGPGSHFGELALVTGRSRAATVTALTPLRAARLSREAYEELAADRPAVLRTLLEHLVGALGVELVGMTERMSGLLRQAALPRRAEVDVRLPGGSARARAGTTVGELLEGPPPEGQHTVAALLDGKAVSLSTPVTADASVAPLTTAREDGRRIFRASAGLLLLEAAWRLDPKIRFRIGPSKGFAQVLEVEGLGAPAADAERRRDLAARLTSAMRELAATDPAVRTERWTVEEATARLRDQGFADAERLLRVTREANVSLASCGRLYTLCMGPLLPSLGPLREAEVLALDGGLFLYCGIGERPALRRPANREMARAHEKWLEALGVTSVGAFNDLCVSGQVTEIIRVSEGFHEKRIGAIADGIAARGGRVRVICIAGPSSSGKTTFIKRLRVQLRIHGLNPIGISLDDYYVDRERTVRDANGDYDFEALEALDLPLLEGHLRRVLAGEAVRTARYDFLTGRSLPEAGPRVTLGVSDVLLLEGIHGLNPRLLGAVLAPEQAYRVFIDPTTTLRFDALTPVSASDLRLLRRIVRDRVRRGYNAAENIARWPSVRAGERSWIFPFDGEADAVFDSSLIYEVSVLKVYAERYLLEAPRDHPSYATAFRLRQLTDRFVTIYPEHVPPTSLLREFIGGSGFEY